MSTNYVQGIVLNAEKGLRRVHEEQSYADLHNAIDL